MYIDEPMTEKVKTEMSIKGWVMTEDEEATIKIYINDEEKTGLTIEREEREDVIKAIEGYGGREKNPTPGFRTKIDTSGYADGCYELKIQIVSRNGEILDEKTRTVEIKKYDARICIDVPTVNQVYRGSSMIIKGWEMSEYPESILKIMIDDVEVDGIERQTREDVLNAITNYGGRETNSNPGFYIEKDITNLNEGYHTLKIEVYSGLNELMSREVTQFIVNREYLLGIDISEHNGDINWQSVKESGINFAIIRCGYGQNFASQDDKKYLRNVTECERLGIPYGIYLYSYADSRTAARSEAEHVIRLLNGRIPQYGIWIDMEDADGYKVRNGIPYERGAEICDEFCSYMRNRGYSAGIYASLDWLNNYLNVSYLEEYSKWVAQWNSQCTYGKKYIMWQYTSQGQVNGISGNVDMDRYYKY